MAVQRYCFSKPDKLSSSNSDPAPDSKTHLCIERWPLYQKQSEAWPQLTWGWRGCRSMMNLVSGELLNMQATALSILPLAPGKYLEMPSRNICAFSAGN